MRCIKRFLSLLVCAVAVCVLVACSQQDSAQKQVGFIGREARAASEIDAFVEKALQTANERKQQKNEDATEGDEAKESAEAFLAGNEQYHAGAYAEAQASYEDMLKTEPLNYGANINLTMALLQQEKNEDALTQALVCVNLFDDDTGALLNAQAAGAACGFKSEDVTEALRSVLEESGKDSMETLEGNVAQKYWRYNVLWSDIETELYGTPESSTYKGLQSDLKDLGKDLYNDKDVAYLQAYLDAVGVDLGFEAGEKSAESDAESPAKDASSANAASTSDSSSVSASTSSDSSSVSSSASASSNTSSSASTSSSTSASDASSASSSTSNGSSASSSSSTGSSSSTSTSTSSATSTSDSSSSSASSTGTSSASAGDTTSASSSSQSTIAEAVAEDGQLSFKHFPVSLFDTDDYSLRFTGYDYKASNKGLEVDYTFENRADKTLGFTFDDNWKLNGKSVKATAGDTLRKKGTAYLSFVFKDPKTDEFLDWELESFEGTVIVIDDKGNELDSIDVAYRVEG